MDAAQIRGSGEAQEMLSPSNYLDKPMLPAVDFGMAAKAYDAESIRRFQKEMWRDGKGTGYICYYERFDV